MVGAVVGATTPLYRLLAPEKTRAGPIASSKILFNVYAGEDAMDGPPWHPDIMTHRAVQWMSSLLGFARAHLHRC